MTDDDKPGSGHAADPADVDDAVEGDGEDVDSLDGDSERVQIDKGKAEIRGLEATAKRDEAVAERSSEVAKLIKQSRDMRQKLAWVFGITMILQLIVVNVVFWWWAAEVDLANVDGKVILGYFAATLAEVAGIVYVVVKGLFDPQTFPGSRE
jgi:hypothetical protein